MADGARITSFNLLTGEQGSTTHPDGGEEANVPVRQDVRYTLTEADGAPGEWYLDRKTGLLSYKPMPGEDPEKVEAIVPVMDQILRIEGASKLRFAGIGVGARAAMPLSFQRRKNGGVAAKII